MAKTMQRFVGVDVSKSKLHLAFDDDEQISEFANDEAGRKALVRFLKKHGRSSVVVVEATGVYGLDLAMALNQTKAVTLRYINPLISKAYSARNLRRAKTDRVDARMLASMARSMDLQQWQPPAAHHLELRNMTRRILSLTETSTQEKNRLSAVMATKCRTLAVMEDLEAHIAHLKVRIEALRAKTEAFVARNDDLAEMLRLVTTVRGIGVVSALPIVGEIACLPSDLSPKQLVAQAGLDPRAHQSGRRDAPRHISKAGSRYLRAALYMPAINAVHHCPQVAHFYKVLTERRNKPPMVAYTAISRKLLCTIHGILKSGEDFDAMRFYQPKGRLTAAA